MTDNMLDDEIETCEECGEECEECSCSEEDCEEEDCSPEVIWGPDEEDEDCARERERYDDSPIWDD